MTGRRITFAFWGVDGHEIILSNISVISPQTCIRDMMLGAESHAEQSSLEGTRPYPQTNPQRGTLWSVYLKRKVFEQTLRAAAMLELIRIIAE